MQVQPSAPLIQQPQLGPQMVDVIDMAPPSGALANGPSPADNCSSCPPGGGDIAVVQSPEKPKEKVLPSSLPEREAERGGGQRQR